MRKNAVASSALLPFVIALTATFAAGQTWDCGQTPGTVFATLDSEGTLTVSGVGKMKHFTTGNTPPAPWTDYRSRIVKAVIETGVTSIGNAAFYHNDGYNSMRSVAIPSTVTSIGQAAFAFCNGLKTVIIPNSVTFIDTAAFMACNNLESIIVASDNEAYSSGVLDGILYDKTHSVLICCPAGKVGDVIILYDVSRIATGAFFGCGGLTSIVMPNSVTSIEQAAFFDCDGLVYMNIPDGVTTVGDNAFVDCGRLVSVTIGRGVASIGDGAFSGCGRLTSLTSLNHAPPAVSSSTFNGVNKAMCVLYTPQSSIGAYSEADGWRDFQYIHGTSAITSAKREIAQINVGDVATIISPIDASGFTAGPSPALRRYGIVNFYRSGKRIENATLYIYNAAGNIIDKIALCDKATTDGYNRRIVGSWSINNAPIGTYLARGTIKTADGKRERVSVVVGVR